MKKVSLVFTMALAASMAIGQNKALTEQIGNTNGVTVNQSGDKNDATSHQFGDENTGLVKQKGTSNLGVADQLKGDKNNATVDQDGTSNEAYLVQGMKVGYYLPDANTIDMPSNQNVGSIKQVGNADYSELLQVGNKNTGTVNQNGMNNSAWVYQGWAGDWWNQPGDISHLESYESNASINQIHDNNQAAIWQYGGSKNAATILQDGSGNNAKVAQGFIYDDMAYDFTHPVYNTINNTIAISQTGDGNTGKVFQLGNSNSFSLTQTGNSNAVGKPAAGADMLAARNAYFRQDGNDNTFVGTQKDGATLDYESFQEGNFNGIVVNQGSGDMGLIKQDGDLNTATLLQGGGGQNATILQTGNSNVATVSQQ